MTRVRWSPAAADDLQKIAEFLNEHHPDFAEPTTLKLFDAAVSLAQFPNRGRAGREADTRELVLIPLPYVIIYRVTESAVLIVRILHGAQDWPGRKPLK